MNEFSSNYARQIKTEDIRSALKKSRAKLQVNAPCKQEKLILWGAI